MEEISISGGWVIALLSLLTVMVVAAAGGVWALTRVLSGYSERLGRIEAKMGEKNHHCDVRHETCTAKCDQQYKFCDKRITRLEVQHNGNLGM